jgi:tetratricopeptide (TPR) repeat protein
MLNRLSLYLILGSWIQVVAGNNGWIQETVTHTINTNFNKALQIVEQRIEADSNDYQAQFYLAATLNSRMTHFENQEDADQFNKAIDKTLNLIQQQLEKSDDMADSLKAELYFYKGSAYGYRAFFQGNHGNFIGAVTNGLKSVGSLNQTLEIDSSLYGAYLGIGVYKYWRYSRLKYISWLPFIPDEREEGIAMIKLAIARDSLSKYMAMHQLVYILLDYGHYDEAIQFAEKIVRKYPKSQFMWWANAHAYYKKGDYLRAKSSYQTLYNLIIKDDQRNVSHLLKCKFKLAEIHKELLEFEECKKQCTSIIELSEKVELNNNSEEIVNWTIGLLEDCESQLQISKDGS